MKNSLKKLLVLSAVSAMMIITSAASVSAQPTVRPMPGSTNTVTTSGTSASDEAGAASDNDDSNNNAAGTDENSGVTRTAPTAIPTTGDGQVSIVTDTEQTTNKKGVSIGAMILWLLISVIINAGVSFWIGNRFYRLSKKDTHLTSEIRALRRDVEEKFLLSVGGFSEQETDIANANEDYSLSDEGITIPRRKYAEDESAAEEDELLRKWEGRQANQRQQRPSSHIQESKYEPGVRRKYQPTREEIEAEEDNDSKSGIKNKAKEILGDIFPFKED